MKEMENVNDEEMEKDDKEEMEEVGKEDSRYHNQQYTVKKKKEEEIEVNEDETRWRRLSIPSIKTNEKKNDCLFVFDLYPLP